MEAYNYKVVILVLKVALLDFKTVLQFEMQESAGSLFRILVA